MGRNCNDCARASGAPCDAATIDPSAPNSGPGIFYWDDYLYKAICTIMCDKNVTFEYASDFGSYPYISFTRN